MNSRTSRGTIVGYRLVAAGGLSGHDGRRLDLDAGQPVQPDHLDQPADLRLRPANVHPPPRLPQAARQHREVEHERRIGETQQAKLEDKVALDRERPGQRVAAQALGRSVLVTLAVQYRGVFNERDDGKGTYTNATARLKRCRQLRRSRTR